LRPRPVLMPGGWPKNESQREACARALLACGGDFDRVYDESGLSLDAYIRHLIRVPFFRQAQESPIVLVTGKIQTVLALLEFYTRVFELTDQFNQASWLVYLVNDRPEEFIREAKTWGDVTEMGRDTYCWHTAPCPILIVSENSKAAGLRQALADLELSPESGVVTLRNQKEDAAVQVPAPALPPPKVSSSLSSGSLARLRFETGPSRADLPANTGNRRSPTPPSNPRIRRHTG
jgi:hypothetical protein